MKNHNIDLTIELAEILRFVTFVVKAIETGSGYNSNYKSYPEGEGDFGVMWLSDSLHKLDLFTKAIETGSGCYVVSPMARISDSVATKMPCCI